MLISTELTVEYHSEKTKTKKQNPCTAAEHTTQIPKYTQACHNGSSDTQSTHTAEALF